MQQFIVEKIRVSGRDKIDGIVEFKDGLNIIQGRSNTGKTWVLRCIYYLFGSDRIPFSKKTGYTQIEGIFNTRRYGKIRMVRQYGDNVVSVFSDNDEVEDGEYATSYEKENLPHYLNDLWIKILGLNETIKVPSSARYARERISWNNLASVFFVDENEIDSTGSIILRNPTSDTALLASLLFLATGDYKEGIDEILKPEVAKAAKEAVVSYVDEQIQRYTDEKSENIRKLEQLENANVPAEMEKLNRKIDVAKDEAAELVNENNALTTQTYSYQQRIANGQVLIDRYEALISQYKADLERLDFIAKGEKAVSGLPSNLICPFCGSPVIHNEENFSNAIASEITRIASELTVVVATEDDVKADMESAEESINELQRSRDDLREAISQKMEEINGYIADLDKFKAYTTLKSNISYAEAALYELGQKRTNTLKKPSKNKQKQFHVKAEFEALVGDEFEKSLNEILKACNFHSGYAGWDFQTADILIDGDPKGSDEGKGYRSFINSAVAVMLNNYFNNGKGRHIKPGFMMIDTPLLGFDEDDTLSDKESLKTGLYQYFIDHVGDGQMIIVDNLNVIPDMDFESQGVNVITYHKNEVDGHVYGFMPSWRRDLPKEKK